MLNFQSIEILIAEWPIHITKLVKLYKTLIFVQVNLVDLSFCLFCWHFYGFQFVTFFYDEKTRKKHFFTIALYVFCVYCLCYLNDNSILKCFVCTQCHLTLAEKIVQFRLALTTIIVLSMCKTYVIWVFLTFSHICLQK